MPAVPIQPSRQVIPSTKAQSAEANQKTRANTNGNSLEVNSNACANANAKDSAKANPLQTRATSSAPVNAPVSAANENPTGSNPGAVSNADGSTAKEQPTEANPSALSNADAKDKPGEASPNSLSNTNRAGAEREPVESKSSAAVEVQVSNAKLESVEPNSSGLLQPDVSNILPPVPQLSKGKQPELPPLHNIPTPQGSLSNLTVNSQFSIAEGKGVKKKTLDFEHPLAGWDGGWGPAPVEWGGRPSFDHRDSWHVKTMHDWLHQRAREALHNPSVLDTTDPKFGTGEALAAGDIVLHSPIDKDVHNTIRPDDEFTQAKASENASDKMQVYRSKIKVEKQETKAERRAFRQAMREAQANYVPPPNPHTPEANIYIRPADPKDLKQISEIYNHYIAHSEVVAEISPLTEQQWRGRWLDATDSSYAFLVAVQLSGKGGGNNRRTSQETICGFAYADDFGDVSNAWRYTCELQCYVGHWTLRKGVGKSLIDRMLGALDPIYAVRAGARFEGGENRIRYEGGGVRVVHKVIINLPYAPKDEETLRWQKEWLGQFQFEHVGTLPGVGRKFDKP